MRNKGLYAALASAVFLGMAPVFGKHAISLGMPWQGVVALRTMLAALLLLVVLLIFKRQYLFIYPAGLLGCMLAGLVNGLGSLFYYAALGRIDASLGQLLYSLYPLFVVVWLWIDGQPPSRLTLFRLVLILPALLLLRFSPHQQVDMWGMLMMMAAAALYALHLPINQRVLFDMPAETVTFYTLLSMSLVVVPAYFLFGDSVVPSISTAWGSILGLTLVTFLSRLTLFLGVKHLGGMQTALLGLGELLVTVVVSHLWLGERLSNAQWVGALLLMFSLALIAREKPAPRKLVRSSLLNWLRPPGIPKDMIWPPGG
ncbi:MAG: DMT family transporter [Anaerolineales bacterium]|nr:DMT family transporter [Anaerolineales bacterium]